MVSKQAFTIEFQPLGMRIRSEDPLNALDAARQAGINIMAVCGGEGTCGKCAIQVLESRKAHPPTKADEKHFRLQEIKEGYRLACMTELSAHAKIYLPPSSILEDQVMQTEGTETFQDLHPAVTQQTVQVEKANLKDLLSDLSRIKTAAGMPDLSADLAVLQKIPQLLRENGWKINLLLRDNKVVHVSKEKLDAPLGLAVDVGSTKIACYLLDLETGKTLTAKGTPNPQIAYGEDIMARLAHAMENPENASKLHNITMAAINETAQAMCRRVNRSVSEIADLCLVGNTAMHHFLLDLPTGSLAVSPFVPAASDAFYLPADELVLSAMPGAAVYAPPVKAGFIGSDHIAFLHAAQFGKDDRVRLGIDIGTNTEIALQARGRIVSVSTASGPAFEGAHIAHGMRAAPGAIEHVRIDENGDVDIDIIGEQEAIGICGSGILDAVAQLRSRKYLNERGRFSKDDTRLQPDAEGKPAFHLTQGRKPITLSQQDVDQILLAKGAIRAGIDILMDHLQVKKGEIDEVVIAGAFGSYMLPEHAIGIGILPEIALDKIKIIGNAAGTGARLMLLSTNARDEAEKLAQQIEYLELTVYPDFPMFYARGIQA